jgi:uncharacterized RDD family membrane protein YckC
MSESGRPSPEDRTARGAVEDNRNHDGHAPGRPNLLRRAFVQPVSSVADAVMPVLVDAVDLNEALSRIDIDEVMQRVDVGELISKVNPDDLLDRVDIDQMLDRIDVDRLLDRVDVDRLLDRVDVDRLLDRVDVGQLVARVGIEEILKGIDLDALLQQIDPDALLQRVDVNALIGRIDMDQLVDRLDVNAVVDRIRIGSVVTRSTGGLLTSLLDLIRRQVVGLDVVVERVFDRFRKDGAPSGPPLLASETASMAPGGVSGRYAGPASRLVAFAIDTGVVFGSFALGSAVISYIVDLLFGLHIVRNSGLWWTIALFAWWFVYLWAGLALTGRTVGKATVGLRIVSSDGAPITQRQALVRVLVFPLSFLLLGIGLLIALVQRERRALHDLAARTCEVYDWGDRPAEMPAPLTRWLSHRGALEAPPPAHFGGNRRPAGEQGPRVGPPA